MKRTYFYLFSLVMTLTSCVNGIAPSKNKITKKYSVEAFDNIASQGTVNIVFKQSNATTVEAYGPDNIISSLIVTSEDSTLHISMKKGVKFRSFEEQQCHNHYYCSQIEQHQPTRYRQYNLERFRQGR